MRSILLVKTSSLGDVVHNLPVVSDLCRIWPEVAIDWVVEAPFAEIPALHPGVRRVLPVHVRKWRKHLARRETWHEIRRFTGDMRSNCYDLVLDTQGLIKSGLIAWLADGLRCGYTGEVARERWATWFYDCRYAIPPNAHAVERNRWLAAAAGGYTPDLPLHYGIYPPETGSGAEGTGSPYCVLLTATSRDEKLWPETHWVALGQTLAGRGLRCLLPAGSDMERERAGRLAAAIPEARVMPPASLGELATLMAGAAGIVGVDTGLTHLAAALSRPVVALYLATDPGLTGVYAGPNAINLGGRGQIPSADVVCERILALMDVPSR